MQRVVPFLYVLGPEFYVLRSELHVAFRSDYGKRGKEAGGKLMDYWCPDLGMVL